MTLKFSSQFSPQKLSCKSCLREAALTGMRFTGPTDLKGLIPDKDIAIQSEAKLPPMEEGTVYLAPLLVCKAFDLSVNKGLF
jgi:hypothetical protein